MIVGYIRACMANIKAEEADLESYKAEVMKYMGEAGTLLDANEKPVATWRTSKPTNRFDTKVFQKEHPEIYAQYLKIGEPTRAFRLK
jgi:hypothetical protein